MIVATGISSLFHCTGMAFFFGRMPLSYYFFGNGDPVWYDADGTFCLSFRFTGEK